MLKLTSLRECLNKHAHRIQGASWESADNKKLSSLITDAAIKMYGRPSSVDALRAFIWLASAEFSRRGVAPRYRGCLGMPKKRPRSLPHAVVKLDAPFIDLQWIAIHYPNQELPKRMRALLELSDYPDPDRLPHEAIDSKGFDLDALGRAERLVTTKGGIGRKCRQLGLSKKQQIGLRSFCEESVHRKIKSVEVQAVEIEQRIRAQKIPQLSTQELIEARLKYWKAWKLAGGSTHWQDAADILNFMTGKTVSRQAVRDTIGRMKTARTVRRNRRKSVKKAVITRVSS